MRCSQCHFEDTKVIESRDAGDGQAIRRRRSCPECGYRFTTYERVERPQLVVVKSDGTRQLFSREKLLRGLYRACEKTPVTNVEIERLVGEVEQELYTGGEPEVPSSRIGDLVMPRLAGLNEIAYVRFASVYRRFSSVAEFERELSRIKNLKVPQAAQVG